MFDADAASCGNKQGNRGELREVRQPRGILAACAAIFSAMCLSLNLLDPNFKR